MFWMILMGPALIDLPAGIAAAAAGTWASTLLWPADSKISVPGLARFLIRFLPQSVVAGVDIARRVFTPRPTLHPGFVVYHSSLPAGMARDAACAVMSLQPGKLPIATEADGTLHFHCLDLREPVEEQIAADEAAFCEALYSVRRHG
ncbi:Na+/H+ antiporter subunit E [Microvirga sp. 2YAF29]|uniref:Na+/H+ antiporter subunit E n=1 Tax=Microvirga sp. 2YAF29 TaxID=3233031 RepID=UPI003F981D73